MRSLLPYQTILQRTNTLYFLAWHLTLVYKTCRRSKLIKNPLRRHVLYTLLGAVPVARGRSHALDFRSDLLPILWP